MSHRRMGGLTVVARELSAARGKLVTRQGVYMWWKRRARNGFPDRRPMPNGKGTKRELFDIDEVIAWYDVYMSKPWQGRKRSD